MRWESAPSPCGPDRFAVIRHAEGVSTVECDGFTTKRRADQLSTQMNASHADREARRLAAPTDPADRKIPKGFYTDAEAD